MNAKTENAENFLSEIRGHFESNQLLRRYYGDFVGKKWNEGEIIVLKRTKVLKDPTVYCAGVGASVVSRHVDLVIADDVVNETNTTTRDQIEKVKDWWRLVQSCGDGPETEWRIVGTRYHFDDLYGDILQNFPDMYDIYIRRVYEDGKLIYPQKFTEQLIEEIKREQGTYIYSCTPGDSEILMSDFTTKPISEVLIGEEIIGYTVGSFEKRGVLVKTRVLGKNSRVAEVQKVTLDSGQTVRCTPDHQWFTGRGNGDKTHRKYAPVKVGGRMIRVLNGNTKPTQEELLDWRYLAGIIDGEGACKYGGVISISQSRSKNPEVYQEIKNVLERLGLDYRESNQPSKECSAFHIKGGRSIKSKILRYGKPAKKQQILDGVLNYTSRIGLSRDKVVSIEPDGTEEVFALVTETGNYISQNYASKNCQYLNNPVDDDEAIFKRGWLKFYRENEINSIGKHNVFITLDPAVSEEATADYSVFTVNFVDRFNNWWIKEFRSGRFRTKELIDLIFELDEIYKPICFGVESNAFQKIIHYQLEEEMKRRNYFIPITELKPDLRTKKSRIRGLQPRFEYGTILLPEETKETDLFLNEYLRFPKTTHDDRLDSLAYQLDVAYPPRPKEGRKIKPKILSKLTGY